MSLLTVEGASAGYGEILAVQQADLRVEQGEVVSILGANGAGKTSLLLTISGHLPLRSGRITFDGAEIGGRKAHELPAEGLVMVPEGGRLFPFMTVLENLQLGAFHRAARARMLEALNEMMDLFPILRERKTQLAGRLSGGERQMAAIARGMMSQPKLLMLDEPSLGLSPLMVEKVFEIVRALADRGVTVLLVEQNVSDALALANRAYVMENGRISRSGTGDELRNDEAVQRAYMGL